MGIVDEFFVNTFSSTRPLTGSNGNDTQGVAIVKGSCLLTKLQDRTRSYEQELFGKEYRIYLSTDHDVQVGDVFTINGRFYGIQDFDDDIPDMFENTDHMQVLVAFKQRSNG